MCYQPRVLNTLRPFAGASVAVAAFFTGAALVPTAFLTVFAAAAGAFFVGFTIVVPVENAELLEVLLTVLSPSGSGAAFACFLTGLESVALPAFVLGRPAFVPLTILSSVAVAAAAPVFPVDRSGFNGEVALDAVVLCGESPSYRIGDWGNVREFADLGESTVDGLGAFLEVASLVTLVRFFGLGIGSSCIFTRSLSSSIASL